MDFQLSFTIEGEQQLSRRLRHAAETVGDLRQPFDQSGRELRSIFENDVFRTRGDVVNERWRPLSPVTLARKARKGYPSDPLIATGKMQKSFKHEASRDQVVIYNEAPYFKYHQSNKPRKRLPRRVMMKLADKQRQMVVRIFNTHLRKQL